MSFDSASWITPIVQDVIAMLVTKLISMAYLANKEKILKFIGVANMTGKIILNTFFRFITEIFLVVTLSGYLFKYTNQYIDKHDNDSIAFIVSSFLLLIMVVVITYRRNIKQSNK